jgi:hypothetical protein
MGNIWEEEGGQQQQHVGQESIMGLKMIKAYYIHVGDDIIKPIIFHNYSTLIKGHNEK